MYCVGMKFLEGGWGAFGICGRLCLVSVEKSESLRRCIDRKRHLMAYEQWDQDY